MMGSDLVDINGLVKEFHSKSSYYVMNNKTWSMKRTDINIHNSFILDDVSGLFPHRRR